MKLGSCYKFRAFDYAGDYLININGTAYNSEKDKTGRVMRVVKGFSGSKNTVSLTTVDGKSGVVSVNGDIKF